MAFDLNDPNLVGEYVAGRLSEEDTDAFETELLTNQDLQAQVFVERELKDALADQASELLESPEPGLFERLRDTFSTPTWGYAATGLLVLSLGWNLLPSPKDTPDGTSFSYVDNIVYVETLRSTQAPIVTLKHGSRNLLSFDAIEFDAGQVTLDITRDGKSVFSLSELRPNDEYSINVLSPELDAGDYLISLKNADATKEFKLVVTP